MTKIFFDLDGTLINASNRLYTLFQKLVPQSKFSLEEYWELKQQKINHQEILKKYFPQINYDDFNQTWLKEIETKEMLDLDYLYNDVVSTLEKLKPNHSLFVLTARQNKENLLYELNKLKIFKLFDDVFLTEHKKSKDELIQNIPLAPTDMIVGDTGYDIQIGQKCGLKTIAITHGFLNESILQGYAPDYIIYNIKELKIFAKKELFND